MGNGVFWSSAGGKSYPIPIRVMSFEELYRVRDPSYNLPAANTFVRELRTKFRKAIRDVKETVVTYPDSAPTVIRSEDMTEEENTETIDLMETYIKNAIEAFKSDEIIIGEIKSKGKPWYGVQVRISQLLPEVIEEKERLQIAYNIVRKTLDATFGNENWHTEKRPKKNGLGTTSWIIVNK